MKAPPYAIDLLGVRPIPGGGPAPLLEGTFMTLCVLFMLWVLPMLGVLPSPSESFAAGGSSAKARTLSISMALNEPCSYRQRQEFSPLPLAKTQEEDASGMERCRRANLAHLLHILAMLLPIVDSIPES
jgi:hypothetical protein